MKKSNRQKWSGEQKAAVAAELETHIGELLQQSIRLNQEAQDKLKLVTHCQNFRYLMVTQKLVTYRHIWAILTRKPECSLTTHYLIWDFVQMIFKCCPHEKQALGV